MYFRPKDRMDLLNPVEGHGPRIITSCRYSVGDVLLVVQGSNGGRGGKG